MKTPAKAIKKVADKQKASKPRSLVQLKADVVSEIKSRDPKANPKLTKVGLFDLMPEADQDDLRMDLNELGPMSSPQSPFFGTKNAYKKEVKRLAIQWFKSKRGL